MSLRVLLLAGTAEARRLASGLAGMPGVAAQASLAGATARPAALALPTRVGGFGGAAGFAGWLAAERIDAVLDATHPFAVRISARSAAICRDRGIPYLQLRRPAWQPGPGDRWYMVAREQEVAGIIPGGARVFMATGPARLDRFAGLAGCHVICRRVDATTAPFPLPDGRFVQGRPPFEPDAEAALFRKLRVDWLVSRNAGGGAGRGKLQAARDLGLPVAMIARPSQPDLPHVATVAEALNWIESRTWTNASS